MAAKKRKKAKAKKAVAKKAKRTPVKAKKTAKKANKAAKAKAKKKAPAKAKKAVAKKAKRAPVKAKKRKTKDVIGEGNYTAARNFRQKETSFIDNNRDLVAKKAKEAEAAIDGPEGAELEAAREETAARGQE